MTDKHDKLVEMARECGFSLVTNEGYQPTPAKLAAFRDRIVASLCADVEPVGEVVLNYSSQLERCHPDGDMNEVQWLEGSPTPSAGTMLYPATAIASLTAQRDAALARATDWKRLYDRAINEANGLTNYVEDRPELRSAERRLDVISADARALKGQP